MDLATMRTFSMIAFKGWLKEQRLGHALLTDVMAHEIGHHLLGSKSHAVSGIMCGRWTGQELRKISEGNMFFLASESSVIRERLISRQGSVPTVTRPSTLPTKHLLP